VLLEAPSCLVLRLMELIPIRGWFIRCGR
jgi:hypothetical protein